MWDGAWEEFQDHLKEICLIDYTDFKWWNIVPLGKGGAKVRKGEGEIM